MIFIKHHLIKKQLIKKKNNNIYYIIYLNKHQLKLKKCYIKEE